MKLEIGRRYVTRDGRVTSPLAENSHPVYTFRGEMEPNGWESWKPSGEYLSFPCPEDLVAEYVEQVSQTRMNMQRKITDHAVNPANEQLQIWAEDPPGAGGAQHRYVILGFDTATNPSTHGVYRDVEILFQNGPIAERGVNGVTHEALIAIVVDRLRAFQAGPYACRENALALTKLEEAQHWLLHRTRARQARSVEGTSTI